MAHRWKMFDATIALLNACAASILLLDVFRCAAAMPPAAWRGSNMGGYQARFTSSNDVHAAAVGAHYRSKRAITKDTKTEVVYVISGSEEFAGHPAGTYKELILDKVTDVNNVLQRYWHNIRWGAIWATPEPQKSSVYTVFVQMTHSADDFKTKFKDFLMNKAPTGQMSISAGLEGALTYSLEHLFSPETELETDDFDPRPIIRIMLILTHYDVPGSEIGDLLASNCRLPLMYVLLFPDMTKTEDVTQESHEKKCSSNRYIKTYRLFQNYLNQTKYFSMDLALCVTPRTKFDDGNWEKNLNDSVETQMRLTLMCAKIRSTTPLIDVEFMTTECTIKGLNPDGTPIRVCSTLPPLPCEEHLILCYPLLLAPMAMAVIFVIGLQRTCAATKSSTPNTLAGGETTPCPTYDNLDVVCDTPPPPPCETLLECHPWLVAVVPLAVVLLIGAIVAIIGSAAEARKRKQREKRQKYSLRAGLFMHFQSLTNSNAGSYMTRVMEAQEAKMRQKAKKDKKKHKQKQKAKPAAKRNNRKSGGRAKMKNANSNDSGLQIDSEKSSAGSSSGGGRGAYSRRNSSFVTANRRRGAMPPNHAAPPGMLSERQLRRSHTSTNMVKTLSKPNLVTNGKQSMAPMRPVTKALVLGTTPRSTHARRSGEHSSVLEREEFSHGRTPRRQTVESIGTPSRSSRAKLSISGTSSAGTAHRAPTRHKK